MGQYLNLQNGLGKRGLIICIDISFFIQLGNNGPDRRKAVALQIVRTEEAYYQQLRIIRDVYYKPLLASLNSNKAILSQHNLKMIFTDINNLVPVSR